jgi:hypothetical protein
MDLRRNRLDGGLTRPPPAPTFDKYEEKWVRDAVAALALLLFRPACVVNSLVQKYTIVARPAWQRSVYRKARGISPFAKLVNRASSE